MVEIRGLACLTGGVNTGYMGCELNLQKIIGIALVPKGWSTAIATGASADTIKTAFLTAIGNAMKNDVFASRAQLIGAFESFTDNSTEPTKETLGYGGLRQTDSGKYNLSYTFDNGGLAYFNAVRTFHNSQDRYDLLLLTADGVVVGANIYDTAGNLTGFKGLNPDNINVPDQKLANQDVTAKYMFEVTLEDSTELNQNMFALATGINIFKYIKALTVINVKIEILASTGTRAYPVKISSYDGTNLADTLGATLENTDLYVAANKATGVAVGFTSIALNAVTKNYLFTFASGGGYNATDTLQLYFTTLTLMIAESVMYYQTPVRGEVVMS